MTTPHGCPGCPRPVHGDITFPRGPFQRLLERIVARSCFNGCAASADGAHEPGFTGRSTRGSRTDGTAHVAGMMLEAEGELGSSVIGQPA